MPETASQTKPRPTFVRVFLEQRFLVLFLFLLTTLVAYPYAENIGFGYYAFRILTCAIIALSVFAVSFRRGIAVVALVLAVPSAVENFLHPDLAAGFFPLLTLILSLGLLSLDCGGDLPPGLRRTFASPRKPSSERFVFIF